MSAAGSRTSGSGGEGLYLPETKEPVTGESIFGSGRENHLAASSPADKVFEHYFGMEEYQLVSLTHRDGTPWARTYDPSERGVTIPDGLIDESYHNTNEARSNANRHQDERERQNTRVSGKFKTVLFD